MFYAIPMVVMALLMIVVYTSPIVPRIKRGLSTGEIGTPLTWGITTFVASVLMLVSLPTSRNQALPPATYNPAPITQTFGSGSSSYGLTPSFYSPPTFSLLPGRGNGFPVGSPSSPSLHGVRPGGNVLPSPVYPH